MKPINIFVTAMGDRICMVSMLREMAKRTQTQIQLVGSYVGDLLALYNDDLLVQIKVTPIIVQQNLQMITVHRNPESAKHCINYLGTFYSFFNLPIPNMGPVLDLPKISTSNLPPSPYVVLQPRSGFARNPPSNDFVQTLVFAMRQIGVNVYGIGMTNTPRELSGVDYNTLTNDIGHTMALVKNAAIVMTPNSCSLHLAAGYRVPTLTWLANDGEDWGTNYTPWNVQKTLFDDGSDTALYKLNLLTKDVLGASIFNSNFSLE